MGFFDAIFGTATDEKGGAAAASDLKAGWKELLDEGSGIPYYWNEESGETTWEKPLAQQPVQSNPVAEAKEAGITDLEQSMPDLYNGWFTGTYTYMGSDGETERTVAGTNEINDNMLAAVQAARADGITKMEVTFPPVPNLEEVDFGTALNFQFSKEIREEMGILDVKMKTEVRRALVDWANLHWARRLSGAFPAGTPTFIAHCDQTDKSPANSPGDNVWVGPLARLPVGSVGEGQVLVTVNPGVEEVWLKHRKVAEPGATHVFLNSISGGWTYELGGPCSDEYECIYFLKRISKGWVFRQYPGPWQALVEAPDGSVICLQTFDKKPLLRDAAKVVREFSFSKFSIFNDRYAKGFGGRL